MHMMLRFNGIRKPYNHIFIIKACHRFNQHHLYYVFNNYYLYCKCNKLQATPRTVIMVWLCFGTTLRAIPKWPVKYEVHKIKNNRLFACIHI